MNSALKARFEAAQDFTSYVAIAQKNKELWEAVYRLARVPVDVALRAAAVAGQWHLLVLSEDWCGDAVNTLPVVARLVEQVPSLDLRILARDKNPDLMDRHLTGTSRSIPVIMLLDDQFEERGWWGPRPTELQHWVLEEGLKLPKDERYPKTRQWYARDHGRTTLNEVVSLLERAAGRVDPLPVAVPAA
jgi:hypothetical protein